MFPYFKIMGEVPLKPPLCTAGVVQFPVECLEYTVYLTIHSNALHLMLSNYLDYSITDKRTL